eukprot:TRINITY_DN21775_c0_g1_i1.p1 TRINITY_DN21775_c0_g1~~TRINITY_DN21775_c0_g1_i1.p1  ORF type:complete len:263 (+),score=52.09 TRINITY_DN21775_c0_g1_i1:88-876(+)
MAANAMLRSVRFGAGAARRTLAQRRFAISAVASSVQQDQVSSAIQLHEVSLWSSSVMRRTAFSTSAAPSNVNLDEKLIRVLQNEIDCAVQSDVESLPECTIPFEIEDNTGQKSLILKRKYGSEDIKVEATLMNMGEEDDEDEDEDEQEEKVEDYQETQMHLIVTISKGKGPFLEINCTAYNDEVLIDSVAMKEADSESSDRIAYEGPDFQDLDENLQKSFHKYLEVRGIKAELTSYLSDHLVHKDNKEYTKWLERFKNFLQK